MPAGTEELDPDLDQDNPLDEDTGEEPSEEGDEDKGEGGETPQTVKVGDKEYTLDQLAELEKKGRDYDALLPDYTRKSQRLADIDKGQEGEQKPPEEKPPYHDPNWVPKSYQELAQAIKMAEERGEKKALEALQSMVTQRAEAKQQVDEFVEKMKAKDSVFDEQDYFDYIARHSLTITSAKDLDAAYSAYKEARDIGGAPQKGAPKARKDSVSAPGAGKGTPFAVPDKEIRQSGSIFEAAMDAFHKLKK